MLGKSNNNKNVPGYAQFIRNFILAAFACRRHESGSDEPYEPVVLPLSAVDWSHEPLLRLTNCDLPQPREWTLAGIGQEVRPSWRSMEGAGGTHLLLAFVI